MNRMICTLTVVGSLVLAGCSAANGDTAEESRSEPVFPEYEMAVLASYQYLNDYYIAFGLKVLEPGKDFYVDAAYDGEGIYGTSANGAWYAESESYHQFASDDYSMVTLIYRSKEPFEAEKFAFTAEYYDSNAGQSLTDVPLNVTDCEEHFREHQKVIHGTTPFYVDGTYILYRSGSMGSGGS